MRTSQIIKYHPQNILSCESGLHMNAQPMSLGFGFWLNSLFAYMGGNLLTVQSFIHTHSNDDIFHDSDKMPKHVEMVQTKCQPKIGTDKMPTTIKVWTICQPFVGILSAHRWIVALTTFVGRFSGVI